MHAWLKLIVTMIQYFPRNILASFITDEPSSSRLLGFIIASFAFGAACLAWFKKDHVNDGAERGTTVPAGAGAPGKIIISSSSTNNEGRLADAPSFETRALRNVFSVRQKTLFVGGNRSTDGIATKNAASSSSTGGGGGGSRPFESSYYFAHNGQSTG